VLVVFGDLIIDVYWYCVSILVFIGMVILIVFVVLMCLMGLGLVIMCL